MLWLSKINTLYDTILPLLLLYTELEKYPSVLVYQTMRIDNIMNAVITNNFKNIILLRKLYYNIMVVHMGK